MTLEAAIFRICEEHTWTPMWFRFGEIIVKVPADSPNRHRNRQGVLLSSWSTKNSLDPCPTDVELLGCTGASSTGYLSWVGWDLDVAHGHAHYCSLQEAIGDARRLRDALHGHAEIRLSKSGIGCHVRHLLPEAPRLPASQGPVIAKMFADKLGLKADRSSLGRQAFWLWSRDPQPHGFELIEALHE
ncbi:MAG: hypothetical protein ABSE73_01485 [Planctomycetota bacterium]